MRHRAGGPGRLAPVIFVLVVSAVCVLGGLALVALVGWAIMTNDDEL